MPPRAYKQNGVARIRRERSLSAVRGAVLLCLTAILACGCSDATQQPAAVHEDSGAENAGARTVDAPKVSSIPKAGQSPDEEKTRGSVGQHAAPTTQVEEDANSSNADRVSDEDSRPGESSMTESSEPLPPGHEVIALYQAGKVTEARVALEKWIRNSAEAANAIEVRRAIDLQTKLGHCLAVNLTVYCFKLDRQARGGEAFPPQLLVVAKLARETMLPIIDEAKRLEAAGSPLATPRVIEQREYAERQLADLIPLEIDALKKLGREDDVRRLATESGQLLKVHGLEPTSEPPITAIVLRRTWLGGSETIEFYRNGSATRVCDGQLLPGAIAGKSNGQLGEKGFGELVAELRKLDYLSLEDEYRGNTHDADGHVLTVSSQTGEKTIKDVMAGAPEELERFFTSLRNKAETVGWRAAASEEEQTGKGGVSRLMRLLRPGSEE